LGDEDNSAEEGESAGLLSPKNIVVPVNDKPHPDGSEAEEDDMSPKHDLFDS